MTGTSNNWSILPQQKRKATRGAEVNGFGIESCMKLLGKFLFKRVLLQIMLYFVAEWWRDTPYRTGEHMLIAKLTQDKQRTCSPSPYLSSRFTCVLENPANEAVSVSPCRLTEQEAISSSVSLERQTRNGLVRRTVSTVHWEQRGN